MGITTIAIYDDINNPKYLTGILIKDDGSHYKYRFSMDELLYKTKNSDTIENYEDDSLFLFDEKTDTVWKYDYETHTREEVFDEKVYNDKGELGEWKKSRTNIPYFVKEGQNPKEAFQEVIKERQKAEVTKKEEQRKKEYTEAFNKLLENSSAEIQQKMKSVKLFPDKDSILPEMNDSEASKLNLPVRKFRVKPNIIRRQNNNHYLPLYLMEIVLAAALYKPLFIEGLRENGYIHFISYIKPNRYPAALVDLKESPDGYYDIVHFYIMDNDAVKKQKSS